MSKYVATQKRKSLIPEFDAEEAWLFLLLCGFIVRVQGLCVFPLETWGGRLKAQLLSSYIHPLHPLPLSLTIGSGIMTLTGTLYRKMVITQIWWKSYKSAIHVMVNNSLQYGSSKKTSSTTSAAMQCIISLAFPPLAITITHHGKTTSVIHPSQIHIPR